LFFEKEAGEIAGLFFADYLSFACLCSRAVWDAERLSAVHQTKLMEPAKRRNIANLLSLSVGQCRYVRRSSNV
jgi:hypothetical protein